MPQKALGTITCMPPPSVRHQQLSTMQARLREALIISQQRAQQEREALDRRVTLSSFMLAPFKSSDGLWPRTGARIIKGCTVIATLTGGASQSAVFECIVDYAIARICRDNAGRGPRGCKIWKDRAPVNKEQVCILPVFSVYEMIAMHNSTRDQRFCLLCPHSLWQFDSPGDLPGRRPLLRV